MKMVRRAFNEARNGKGITANHDFRDIRKDISETYNLIQKVSKEYKDVEFEFCEAVDAMRKL